MLIVDPFNATWFALVLLTVLAIWGMSRYSRTHSRKSVKRILLGVDFFCIALFFVYKYLTIRDVEYATLCLKNGQTVSKPVTEYLMCHLCNMQMVLLPLSILTGSRYLKAYCFMVTPPGAVLSLLMPMLGFHGYSLLLPRVFGYYATHLILLFSSISLCSSGLYRTSYSDIPKAGLVMVCASFMAFCVNLILIHTGLAPDANFFQTMGPNDNPVLMMIWNVLPYPWLYYLPVIAFMCLYLYFEIFLIQSIKVMIGFQPIQEVEE